MNEDTKLYTMAEAREIMRKEKCNRQGHDFNIQVGVGAGDPEKISCYTCGKEWIVVAVSNVENSD